MRIFWVAAALFLATAGQAAFSGSDFAAKCSDERPGGREFCEGMLHAYMQMVEEKNICYRLPEGTTPEDIRATTLAFVQSHPAASHIKASILATQALITCFPCKALR